MAHVPNNDSQSKSSSSDGIISHQTKKRAKIIIVGAGMTGLSCANHLLGKFKDAREKKEEDSFDLSLEDIIILEADCRPGGRIHTIDIPINNGKDHVRYDAGAAWIHGDTCQNPLVEYLIDKEKLRDDLKVISPHGNPWTRLRVSLFDDPTRPLLELFTCMESDGCRAGEKMRIRDLLEGLDLYEKLLDTAAKIGSAAYNLREGKSLEADISVSDAIQVLQPYVNRLGYNKYAKSAANFYLYLLELWHGHELHTMPLAEIALDAMPADGDDYHCHYTDTSNIGNDGDHPGSHCLAKHGMFDLVLNTLLKDIDAAVCYGREVISIQKVNQGDSRESKETVLIECNNGEVYEALDYCVVTASIGVLQEVIKRADLPYFCPNISVEKKTSFSCLEMGSYYKLFMIFSQSWWRSKSPPFIGVEVKGNEISLLGPYIMVHNFWVNCCGTPALEIIMVGSKAKRMEAMEAIGVSRVIITCLLKCYFADKTVSLEDVLSLLVHCSSTNWGENRLTKGAYPYWPLTNAPFNCNEDLQSTEWDGLLYMGGDAFSLANEGSISGAFQSGKEICAFMTSNYSKRAR
mmetsp:Transcript_9778/g.12709  ORF Transcript_9778/g.12709 Transcript_9778/m.12709 type:complete len:575 (+) Transcript_9778:111-1835(+)